MTRVISVDQLTYVYSPDDTPSLGGRTWALIRARAVDELSGRPIETEVQVASDLPGSTPRNGPDGLLGVVAAPKLVYPKLAARGYTLTMTLGVPGFIRHNVIVQLPVDQRAIVAPAPPVGATVIALDDASRLQPRETLLVGPQTPTPMSVQISALGPADNELTIAPPLASPLVIGDPVVPVVQLDYATYDSGDIALHREPTVITGRVVKIDGSGTMPLAGATVQLTGLWRTPPPANASIPPDPPNVVSLSPPLYFGRDATASLLRRRNLPAIVDTVSEEKRLLDDAYAGSTSIRIANRIGIALGDVLRIDAGSPDLVEYLAVSTVIGLADPARPAAVVFDTASAFDHHTGALVQRTNPAPLGANRQLAVDTIPGDSTLFLTGLGNLGTGDIVRIADGVAPDEYHQMRVVSATSDPDGYYRLPPISRVAQLQLQAQSSALTPLTAEFRPDYGLPENRLDFAFP